MLIAIGISVSMTSPAAAASNTSASDLRRSGSEPAVHVTCTCEETGLYPSCPGMAAKTCLWNA